MKLLLDTNIVLDVLLKREPWVTIAKELWTAGDKGLINGFLTASALTDIYYVARKTTDISHAQQAVYICLQAFEICPVDRNSLELALSFPGSDFEDNLQIASAILSGLDGIVTRDPTGFKASPITILTPEEALQQLL